MTSFLTDEYRAPAERFAAGQVERARGGDGYDVMVAAATEQWAAIPAWGRDGWDLGDWPYVIVYARRTPEAFELVYYVEGDVTAYAYETAEDRAAAIDELAFFHWRNQGESWVAGIESHEQMPDHLRGPFSWKRAEPAAS